MLQQMMLSMLEASEMATTRDDRGRRGDQRRGEPLRSGITQTDADYDERTGEVLRPITLQLDGIKYGAEQIERLEAALDDSVLPQQDPLSRRSPRR
jgi:hypothetical protein